MLAYLPAFVHAVPQEVIWICADTLLQLPSGGDDPYQQVVSDQVIRNLQKFADANKLQRTFMHLAVSFLNEEELKLMLKALKRIKTDVDVQGTISTEQMTKMLTQGSADGTEANEEVRKIVQVRSLYLLMHVLPWLASRHAHHEGQLYNFGGHESSCCTLFTGLLAMDVHVQTPTSGLGCQGILMRDHLCLSRPRKASRILSHP
ncbi:MAG: hypothetical protein HC767_07315 [Akkermansiaceae bacterium]|nr:hypothetical protein [Akkermansiaceae bacterium]